MDALQPAVGIPGAAPTVQLTLPVPPSANRLWSHTQFGARRPRVRSDEYKAWLHEAGWLLRMQCAAAPTLIATFDAVVFVPVATRIDRDNLTKPIFDILQLMGVVRNDSGLRDYAVKGAERDDVLVLLWDRGGPVQHTPRLARIGAKPRRRTSARDVARARKAGVIA